MSLHCKKKNGSIGLFYQQGESFSVHCVPGVDCSLDLVSSDHPNSGTITSLNYGAAGGYPSNVVCRYRFYGNDRERVRIVFTVFDLHYPNGDGSQPDK